MKKYFSFIIIIVIIFSFVGCANNKDTTEQPGANDTTNNGERDNGDIIANLNDGEYTSQGDKREHGSEEATVVIDDGKISDITLRRLDEKGNEVNYDDWTGEEKDGKAYPNLKQYRIDMANRMLEEQTYEVDTISGATESTEAWKLAVKRALEQAAQ